MPVTSKHLIFQLFFILVTMDALADVSNNESILASEHRGEDESDALVPVTVIGR